MNKIQIVKLAARFIVGAGTTTISKSIIQNNVQPSNVIEQITVAAASVLIGSMASGAVQSHTDTKIDEAVEQIKKIKKTTENLANA